MNVEYWRSALPAPLSLSRAKKPSRHPVPEPGSGLVRSNASAVSGMSAPPGSGAHECPVMLTAPSDPTVMSKTSSMLSPPKNVE